ncbi:MAG: peptidase U32 family protein [Anaerovoracaceae bacterium]|jgi:putative protease
MMELLAPAGDMEKLKIAIDYGADAVYCAGPMFGLRTASKNFSNHQLEEGVRYAHERGKKVYLTMNIFAHNEDIDKLKGYLEEIKDIPLDAFIVSDPGVIHLLQDMYPDAVIHLSTQANTTNYASANFWYGQGVKRIILARELSLDEIKVISEKTPEDMELEAFVHGAMCISYSGRCLLSNYMIGRDANRGECAHPCRWKYALVEEERPGEYFPVTEDERGTYIFNSKDLCMIHHIPQMAQAGITSLKIEGRVKSSFYVATVVSSYRRALDAYYLGDDLDEYAGKLEQELRKVSHRQFSTGFYFGRPDERGQNYETSQYNREYTFLGIIESYDPVTKMAVIEQRNKMEIGDEIEVFGPEGDIFTQKIVTMLDNRGLKIESAPHPQQIISMPMIKPVKAKYLLRKQKNML